MSKKANQKNKMLYLLKYFEENTDAEHSVTMAQIIAHLAGQGIEAERKSIYSDIENLRDAGYDIIGERINKQFYYYLAGRDFELAEIKMLVDAVNSFKFTSEKNSKSVVKKLEKLTSRYQAAALQRQTFVADRIKNRSMKIYYAIDCIHNAISENVEISFKYFRWNNNHEKEYGHNGERYVVSPWKLMIADGNYYLIAYDKADDKIKHYRVDKMEKVELLENKRQGKVLFEKENLDDYSSGVFGMFGGKFEYVTLKFKNYLANVVIDRFGQDTLFSKVDDEHFSIVVKIVPSEQFFGWLFALKDDAEIVSPKSVIQGYSDIILKVNNMYSKKER